MKYSYHASLLVPALFVLVSMMGIAGCTDTLLAPDDTHYIHTREDSKVADEGVLRNDEDEVAEENPSSGEVSQPDSVSTSSGTPNALPAYGGKRHGGSRAKKIIRRY